MSKNKYNIDLKKVLLAGSIAVLTFGVLKKSMADGVWVDQTLSGSQNWSAITSSGNGQYIYGAVDTGHIWSSSDYGVNWTDQTIPGSAAWNAITISDDGKNIAANAGYQATSFVWTSADYGTNWTLATTTSFIWNSMTSSSDGSKLAATESNGYIWTSSDYGVNWVDQMSSGSREWGSITSSASGQYLAATVRNNGDIWTSNDYGATWIDQIGSGQRNWTAITSSANGKYLAAIILEVGDILVSSDYGVTWVDQVSSGPRAWKKLTMSDDGSKIAAVDTNDGGVIYTSAGYGASWTLQSTAGPGNWSAITSSADGSKLAATIIGGDVWTGTISDVTPPFDGGTGVVNDPYRISNCLQLQNISTYLGYMQSNYIVTKDIDCSATSISDSGNPLYEARLYNNGAGFTPIGNYNNPFTGTFDGKGYKISNIFENNILAFAGLFAHIKNATTTNFGLINENISNSGSGISYGTGGLVAYANNSKITKIYTTGNISGIYEVGGLVGHSSNSHIENTYSTANIQGTEDVGGLVGTSAVMEYNPFQGTSIVNSYATGNVTGLDFTGGLVGYVEGDPISNSFATGFVTMINGASIGGLVGFIHNTNGGQAHNIVNSGWYQYANGPRFAVGNSLDELGVGSSTNVTYNISTTTQDGFIAGDQSWFYDKTRPIYTTTLNSEPVWDFATTPVWYEHTSAYPDFVAPVVAPVTPPQQTSSSGITMPARVEYLVKIGNNTLANELIKQWPQFFQASSTPATSTPIVIASSSVPFLRDLKLGVQGADVYRLQVFLNKNGYIVSKIGAGSVGHETIFFGPATKKALIKFQENYYTDILKPAGLINGTGNFYSLTRNFVNKMITK